MNEADSLPYEHIATSHRSAEKLSRLYGYNNLNELAAALPENANILDAGAGDSDLGARVTQLRPDVTWTNLDYNYPDDSLSEDRPRNLLHRKGDVTDLSEYPEGSFDTVLSYFLLPHLSLYSDDPAQAAVSELYRVTRDGGELIIGPRYNTQSRRLSTRRGALRIVKDADSDASAVVDTIVHEVAIPPRVKRLYRATQEATSEVFGDANRHFRRRPKHFPEVYHPESQDFVSVASRPGLSVVRAISKAARRNYRQSR